LWWKVLLCQPNSAFIHGLPSLPLLRYYPQNPCNRCTNSHTHHTILLGYTGGVGHVPVRFHEMLTFCMDARPILDQPVYAKSNGMRVHIDTITCTVWSDQLGLYDRSASRCPEICEKSRKTRLELGPGTGTLGKDCFGGIGHHNKRL